jgi:4-hydroxybenzoate polyprenyltransferase
MAILQLIILMLLVVVGQLQQLSVLYFSSVLIAGGLSVYQQKLIFHRDKTLCFKAFLNNNWFGLVIFVGLLLDYGLR